MVILHAKTPNETQTDLDLSKIVLTDGRQDTPVNTIPVGSTLRFGDKGYIEYRDLSHEDPPRTAHQLVIGNGINLWNAPGSKLALHDYREVDGEQLGLCDGGFNIRVQNNTTACELIGYPKGALTWRGSSLTNGTFIIERHIKIDTSSGGNGYSVSAPAVSGYKFVSWVMTATDGYVRPSYVTHPDNANTDCYIVNGADNGSIYCTAIYIRQW